MEVVNILGTEYSIEFKTTDEDPKLKRCDGYNDKTTKSIVVEFMEQGENTVEDIEIYMRDVLRHELVHAFLHESGLADSSWAKNEEMVDWIALQLPKIWRTYRKVEEG